MLHGTISHLTPAAFQRPLRHTGRSSWAPHVPFAFWCIERWRPKIFVELGTYVGDSYFAFCQSVAAYETGTRCFAVDTWRGDAHVGRYGNVIFDDVYGHNLRHYSEFSQLLRMTFDEAVEQFRDGSIDLLHIDGFHTYEAALHDFETWLPKMSRRGVILFHDSNVFEKDYGVWRLMRELEPRFPHFHFLNGYGLSVFALTEEAPEDARWMTALSPAGIRNWRGIFLVCNGVRAVRWRVDRVRRHAEASIQRRRAPVANL